MRRVVAIALVALGAQTGAAYLFRRRRREYARERRHFLVTQGGAQLRPSAEEMSDAVVSVLMGGLVLDLRAIELARRPARLDILCIMGGVQLVVPADRTLRIEVDLTMAGVHDGRPDRTGSERPPDLVVSGRIVMGGLDVSTELPSERVRRTPGDRDVRSRRGDAP